VFANDPEKWAGASSKGVFLAWQKITEQSLIDATTLHLLLTNTVEAEIQRQLVISRRASASAAEFFTQLGHDVQPFDENKTYLRLKRQLTFCCYGVRHRTFDYPNAVSVSELGNIGQSYRLPIIEGTKIGGAPFNIQSNTQIPGQFLCQLASVQAAPRVPYPWANHETPLTRGFEENGIHSQSWMIGDMGCLYFSIDNGLVYINGESY